MPHNPRTQLRSLFLSAWEKHKKQQIPSALEQSLITLILQHPEYITLMENATHCLETDYATDNNPFLHLSLHLSLQEQVQTNRPLGIQAVYQTLLKREANPHHVEHKMMDVLAHLLFEAQEAHTAPDEQAYLEKLRQLSS